MPLSRLPSCPVTAYSVANALGAGTEEVLRAVKDGEAGLAPAGDALPFAAHWGRMADTLPALPAALGDYDSRVARIAWVALEPLLPALRGALERYGPERVAIAVGSSTGGIAESEGAYAAHAREEALPDGYSLERQHAFGGLVAMLGLATGAAGPAYAVSAACASSAKVFGVAQRLMAAGLADAVLVGGADSLCQTTLRGFAGLKVLSATPCRPFDVARGGINIGEGAAFVLLERDASGDLHLLSSGETSDAHHMTAPHPEGRGALLAMRQALEGAGLDASAIDYVNAHGTGTQSNDAAEGLALHALFGADVPVSSTKGATGHLLGAAGATEAVICLDVLERGVLPPSVGCHDVDPTVRVNVLRSPTPRRARSVLSTSFAFGGCNAALVFGTQPNRASPLAERTVRVARAALWEPAISGVSSEPGVPGGAPGSEPEAALLPARARGRASFLTRLVVEIVGRLVRDGGADSSAVPIVLGSAWGEMGTTLTLLHSLAQGEPLLSPLRFPGSVHNAALGTLSIQTGNQAFSTALAAGFATPAMALVEAWAWLRCHGGDALVVLAEETAPLPLWRGVPFGPLAYGFWLRTSGSAEADEGRELRLSRDGGGESRAGALRSVHAGHPLEGGLDLVDALVGPSAGGQARTGALGQGWAFHLGQSPLP